jgi:beta-N-acetylhexosaminidase
MDSMQDETGRAKRARDRHVSGYRAVAVAILCALVLPLAASAGGSRALAAAPSGQEEDDLVAAWMAQMTPAEKVGQLFIVAFWGRNPSSPSRAGRLIQQYKVGGVVLIASNNNLVNSGTNTPLELAVLCNKLQSMAMGWDLVNTDGSIIPASGEAGAGIPLFIAIDHEGDGFPYTRITNGVTPLPNPMAIGATWDTHYAEQVGEIAGSELAAMGINMLLGPVLDVLSDPRPSGKGDASTRVFGGDPYWVGEMGRAYIRGVHQGSAGKVLTVAKHFPGHGGSDRLPDDEVATVDKSLQELERVELPPFFAVTQATGPEQTDALMSSHIRYRGFYGDIRQFTRPISLDEQSMQAILDLAPLRTWRKDGLLVSDSLGVPAVRKYFDPQLKTFPHRQIAREAFLAGNDLLILSQFALVDDWTQQYNNTVEVIEYFREAYETDPAFAARVDEAVARILRKKLAIYRSERTAEGQLGVSPEQVLVAPTGLSALGEGSAQVAEIARQATTVLHPTVNSLPAPPRRNQDILILAEERMIRECFETTPECDPHPLVPPLALQDAILRLYGPEGSGQVAPEQIHTRTFGQLKAFLTSSPQEGNDVGPLLEAAEWIVFAMLDPNPGYPNSDALQLFLAQNAQQIYHANVIVLAYTAPYYLDATEISKLTAYYVFYSKTEPFIEASARTLFGEVTPQGKSPVSIDGTYYDLSTQLSPDPGQTISLTQLAPAASSTPGSPSNAVIPVTLRVRTGVIRDRNGNPVPDDTQVQFVAREEQSGQIVDTASGLTQNGTAEAALSIDRPGRVVVIARSGDTGEGRALAFEALPQPTPTSAPTRMPSPTALAPTMTPRVSLSPTPSPTPSHTATPRQEVTATPAGAPWAGALDAWHGRPIDLAAVLAGCLLAAGAGWGLDRLVKRKRHAVAAPRRSRAALLAWVGGLCGYLAYGWGGVPLARWVPWPTWALGGLAAFLGAAALVAVGAWHARVARGPTLSAGSGRAPGR